MENPDSANFKPNDFNYVSIDLSASIAAKKKYIVSHLHGILGGHGAHLESDQIAAKNSKLVTCLRRSQFSSFT